MEQARAVMHELVRAGVRREDIGLASGGAQAVSGTAALNEAEGARGSEILVAVAAQDDEMADRVVAALRRHGAVAIGRRPARGVYKGPERRASTTPWLGRERRKAA
jgi:hypothetical protein